MFYSDPCLPNLAEATCVEIVTEMKECFRLKDILNSIFPEIFNPNKHVLAGLIRK